MNIEPCPFCGSKARLLKGKQYKSDGAGRIVSHRPGDWIWRPQIGCKPCRINRVGDSVEQLVTWWNTRAEIERIQNALDGFWRTNPDTLSAVEQVMKEHTELRTRLFNLEQLIRIKVPHACEELGVEK